MAEPIGLPTNCLLDALSPVDGARIAASLELVSLKLRDYFHTPGDPVTHVFFPASGFCSLVSALKDGRFVEIITIGREGVIGTTTATDGTRPSALLMVQAPMPACYRMPIGRFREEMSHRGALFTLVSRFNDALLGNIMHVTACNTVHGVERRLARWLLMAHDRVGDDHFPLTQEFAAMMLGVSRPTVTVIARGLQTAGLITYHRGMLTIHDRGGLEAAACECYTAIAEELRTISATPCVPDPERLPAVTGHFLAGA